MLQDLIDHAPDGAAIEHLERVHRFSADWERDASLRLRHGEVSALDDYRDRGRIHASSPPGVGRRQLVERWWDLRTEGSDVVMLAATIKSVTELTEPPNDSGSTPARSCGPFAA